jgi:hypothetical protein
MTEHVSNPAPRGAKARGERRRLNVTPKHEATIRRLKAEGQGITAIARQIGLSRPTIYAVLGNAPAGAGTPVTLKPVTTEIASGGLVSPSRTTAESSGVGAAGRATDSTPAPSPVPPPGVLQERSGPMDYQSNVEVLAQTPEDRAGTLERIVSNSQTGVGEASHRKAQAVGLDTGGELSVLANVRGSDLTLWFGDDTGTRAAQGVLGACDDLGRPWVRVLSGFTRPKDIAKRLRADGTKILHIAGEPESRAPGIGAQVERFLTDVFLELEFEPRG